MDDNFKKCVLCGSFIVVAIYNSSLPLCKDCPPVRDPDLPVDPSPTTTSFSTTAYPAVFTGSSSTTTTQPPFVEFLE